MSIEIGYFWSSFEILYFQPFCHGQNQFSPIFKNNLSFQRDIRGLLNFVAQFKNLNS